MAALSRLCAGLACVFLVSGCGYPAPAPAKAPVAANPAFVSQEDKPEAGGAVAAAEHLTEVQLLLVQAFRAIKTGDDDLAYRMLGAAKKIAQTLDVARLSDEQKDKIQTLVQFLTKYDRESALASLRKALVNADVDELAIRAKVLIAMKHWYALGRAVLAKDKEGALKELMLAHQALEDIDFDRLDEPTREKMQAIKNRIDRWLKLSDQDKTT